MSVTTQVLHISIHIACSGAYQLLQQDLPLNKAVFCGAHYCCRALKLGIDAASLMQLGYESVLVLGCVPLAMGRVAACADFRLIWGLMVRPGGAGGGRGALCALGCIEVGVPCRVSP